MAMPGSPRRMAQSSPVLEAASVACSGRSVSSTGTQFNCLLTDTFTLQRLPPFDVVAKCVTTFFECTETLFFALKELEAMEMLRTTYSRSKNGATVGGLAQLCLIAAVGSQYLDSIPESFRAAMFNTGRQALDKGAFDKKGQELYKARASALVGILLVFEKTMLAREYLTQAIGIAQTMKLDKNERNPEVGERDWLSWKRLWRTCIFHDRWLASLVGYVPVKINEADPVFSLRSDPIPFCDLETTVQAELVKLAVLSSDLVEDVYSDRGDIDFDAITRHSQNLKTWHDNLPQFMTLAGIENSTDAVLNSAVRFTHCVYLNANLLLTRNAFIMHISGREIQCDDPMQLEQFKETSKRCADTCVQAAYQIAELLVVFIRENSVSRKCWMIIHAAFNAGLFLMLNAVTQPNLKSIAPRDADAIAKILYALDYCAKADFVARRDLDTLRHFHRELETEFTSRSTPSPPPPTTSRQSSDTSIPSLSSTSSTVSTLLLTVRQPFGGESSLLPAASQGTSQGTSQETSQGTSLSPGKGLNWRFVSPDTPLGLRSENIMIAPMEGSPNRKRRVEALEYAPESWRAPVRLKSLNDYREFFKRV